MLKNKDGTPYKLSGPNPMMKNQELWGNFIVHNMEWDEEKAEDNQKLVPVQTDFNIRESFISSLDEAKEELKAKDQELKSTEEPPMNSSVVDKKEVPERKKIVIPEPREDDVDIEKVFIHCLPAFTRKKKDELYGDEINMIKYGDPVSFEGVMLQQEDFFIKVWTDVENINIGSILYPKTNFKRWWRVQEKVIKGTGWILIAMPSDYQPSFKL